jgi:hypothetical protein
MGCDRAVSKFSLGDMRSFPIAEMLEWNTKQANSRSGVFHEYRKVEVCHGRREAVKFRNFCGMTGVCRRPAPTMRSCAEVVPLRNHTSPYHELLLSDGCSMLLRCENDIAEIECKRWKTPWNFQTSGIRMGK